MLHYKNSFLILYLLFNYKTNIITWRLKIEISSQKGKYVTLADVGYLIKELVGDFYLCHYLLDGNLHNIDVELLLDGVSAKSAQVPGVKKGILVFATGTMDTNQLKASTFVISNLLCYLKKKG